MRLASSRNPLSSQVISNKLTQACLQLDCRVVIPYQVRSYQTEFLGAQASHAGYVVIPYQVRSYQTSMTLLSSQPTTVGRNPLSSQVISNKGNIMFQASNFVVIPYQVRSYQTNSRNPSKREKEAELS